jgi:misacylated tRNA(Ala) deacylase
MSSVLSCGSSPAEVAGRVTKVPFISTPRQNITPSPLIRCRQVSADLQDTRRRTRKLEAEIAHFEAQRVMRELTAGKNAAWVYRADIGMDYIAAVTQELKLSDVPDGVVVLAAGEGVAGGPIVIVGNEKRVEEMMGKVKGVVGSVKGGGKGGRWQGKVGAWAKGEIDSLQRLVGSGA